jgi:hypothetical protein
MSSPSATKLPNQDSWFRNTFRKNSELQADAAIDESISTPNSHQSPALYVQRQCIELSKQDFVIISELVEVYDDNCKYQLLWLQL